MRFNQYALLLAEHQKQQQQHQLVQQQLRNKALLTALEQRMLQQQRQAQAGAQRAAEALAVVMQSQEESALHHARNFSRLVCANSVMRMYLLVPAQGKLHLDLRVLAVPGLRDRACSWLVQHMQLMDSLYMRGELNSYDEGKVLKKLSAVLADASAAPRLSAVFPPPAA